MTRQRSFKLVCVKKIDCDLWRRFKVEAADQEREVGELLNEVMRAYCMVMERRRKERGELG